MPCACQLPDVNVSLPVGTAPSWAAAIVDPENANTAVDIAGSSSVFRVKESPEDADGDAVFELNSDDGEVVITSASGGLLQIDHVAEKTALLEVGRWYYWFHFITLSSGEVRLARKGKLEATAGLVP